MERLGSKERERESEGREVGRGREERGKEWGSEGKS
jgi:hypothetical protein